MKITFQVSSKLLENKILITSIFIFLISAVLRFYRLPEKFAWGGVEGSFIWDIWYTASGHLTLIGFESAAIGGLNFPPFLLYFFVPFFWIFAGNPIYIGIILAILGSFTSVLFFLIGKRIFGIKIGLLAAFVHIFSHQAITIDHKFIGGTFMIIPSLVVVYLLWELYQKKRTKFTDFIILGSIIGLSFSAHYQAIFIFLGVIFFLFFYKKESFNIKNLLTFCASTFFWLTPLLLFDLRHNFYHIRGFITLLTGYTNVTSSSGFLVSGQYFLQNFFGIFWQLAYFYQFSQFGALFIFLITLLIFILSFLVIWKNKNYLVTKPLLFYFAALSLFSLVILSFYRSANYQFDYYYWYLVPVFILTGAVFLAWFLEKGKVFSIILLLSLFTLVNINDLTYSYPSEPYDVANKRVKEVLQDAKNRGLSQITAKFHGVEVGSHDYLFYYYSKKFGIDSGSITLISGREEFQERSILGSGKAPIKILPKGAGSNILPSYVITKSGVQYF